MKKLFFITLFFSGMTYAGVTPPPSQEIWAPEYEAKILVLKDTTHDINNFRSFAEKKLFI